MRLGLREFKAMNTAFRRFLQRTVEYPMFQSIGLCQPQQDILEIGCGNGYGATLLARLNPRSYVGVDVMPEQIALARQRPLPNALFLLQDATQLTDIPDASKDVVVIFGVLHHIAAWRQVVAECRRVLRPGGDLFVEEPDGSFLLFWERLFHWEYPRGFTLRELESWLRQNGFVLNARRRLFGFGIYSASKTGTPN